ncbi:hypothetical protein B7494_g5544 [Chlorociboria aeruginascens]|nr:hypothetical protein B7494_g5544 [Chlorociboria aeruginascens]
MSISIKNTDRIAASEAEKTDLLEDEYKPKAEKRSKPWLHYLWAPLLFISMCLNSLFYLEYRKEVQSGTGQEQLSRYAKLSREIVKPFPVEQREMAEEEWLRYDADVGQIVIPDAVSSTLELPPTQRWPWDFSQGMYYLQGYHNLHCLYTVRNSLNEFREGRLQTEHATHIDHCLIELRDDILCNADDTPRYTGGEFGKENLKVEQSRLCRDWDKLVEWAMAKSACYKSPEDPYDGKSELERYKFCPDGSTPWVGAEIWTMQNSQEKGELHPTSV